MRTSTGGKVEVVSADSWEDDELHAAARMISTKGINFRVSFWNLLNIKGTFTHQSFEALYCEIYYASKSISHRNHKLNHIHLQAKNEQN